jgi:hypothetical protein
MMALRLPNVRNCVFVGLAWPKAATTIVIEQLRLMNYRSSPLLALLKWVKLNFKFIKNIIKIYFLKV